MTINKTFLLSLAVFCLAFITAQSKPGAKSKATFSAAGKKITIYTTAEGTANRISSAGKASFAENLQPVESEVTVFADPDKSFQTILGIGGALTDASAETYAKLPRDKQQEFMTAYFDKEKGIGYTLGRTNIHSCDFSSDTYTYISEGDAALKTFNIQHDRQFKIPFIKAAMAAAGGKLTLFASPWSPPAFMKTNGDILHGGKLKKEFYQPWANYYTKFIRAFEAEGIPIWGISIQNEPMATQRWESCIYTGEEERDFLKGWLGPTMQKAGYGNKKIIGWDHNRDLLYQRASTLFKDAAAAKYLWGVGFHWYEPWSGGEPMYDNLKLVNDAFPGKNLLFTEGCKEAFDLAKVYDWKLGEKYGANMIHDFNNGSVGFTDWNILLDEKGGPNHVGNFCFSPIHANTQTGELIYTNEYYYIGHFSKFIHPGAKRIVSSASRSQLLTTAFKNPDGQIVVVVMNESSAATPYALWINGQAAKATALPHSISTLIL
ncbi:MAG: glycoside hydrolase family 30 beta sandwich domain-containing protein [Chitinophagaceae bacterium]